MENSYSAHKSMMLAIREAMALYLFNKSREKDILQVTKYFLSLDEHDGERVPLDEAVSEVKALSTILQDNYLGLNLNSLVNIQALPFYEALNKCIRPYSNLKSKLPFLLVSRLISRFYFIITQSVNLKLTEETGSLRLNFISTAPATMSKHQIDGVMVTTYRIIDAFFPNTLEKVYVAHRSTSYELNYYRSIFGVPVELADKTSFVYNLKEKNHYKNSSDLLIKSEEELGRSFNMTSLTNMCVAQFSDFSCKRHCEILIDIMKGLKPLDRQNVADLMNISVSTLQRKLKAEGTSFKEILDDFRKRTAKFYLTENNLSTTDIACLLGYKSHSQFFKVFKTWFGMTPKTYRNNFIYGK